MSFLQRLKNLWAWSYWRPEHYEHKFKGFETLPKNYQEIDKDFNLRPHATIIKLTKTDPVEDALATVNDEQNG